MSLVPPAEPEPFVTDEVVADHMGVTRMTIYRWTKNLGMPTHKIGGSRRFKLSEVDAWAMARCTSPVPARGAERAS